MTQRASLILAVFSALIFVSRAQAGGYDTPVLYSARHMGMGGAAASYVNDPSGLFHNPAGLAHIGRAAALGDVSPLFGSLRSTPDATFAKDVKSETTFAPFFLVGGAYRLHKYVVAGLGAYPVASAGAEYKYKGAFGAEVTNRTKLMFLEAAPGLAFNLPKNVRLGATYRVTYVNLERYQGSSSGVLHDFKMSGWGFTGFRLGAQWNGQYGEHRVQFGGQYRHKTTTEIKADDGIAASAKATDLSTKFVLPTRFTFGARYDLRAFGVTADVEYALNSQNKGYALKGTVTDEAGTESIATVPNPSRWTDAFTLRTGAEYRLLDERLPVRVGYIWDQKTSNPTYPSAFGTPPGPSHVITAGCGYGQGGWQVNTALAYRMAEGTVNTPDPNCPFCGGKGDDPYKMTMVGAYLDFSYEWK